MIISLNNEYVNIENKDLKKYEYKDFTVFYHGIIWKIGVKNGIKTIESIIDEFIRIGEIDYIKIFGAFSIIIINPNNEIQLFTDNSNMHCFYLGKKIVGTNFLETIQKSGMRKFDNKSVCEFLKFGNIYFGKTFMDGLTLSESDKFYTIKNGVIEINNKNIGSMDNKSTITSVSDYFKEMAYSLSDLKITLSLTGGYDSRLVFTCLKNYISIKTFISGDNENDKDIIIAKKVAKNAGQDFEIIKTQKPIISNEYLEKIFIDSEGIRPFISDGGFRINNFLNNRYDKGFDCLLTGDGGVMHKDWWWLQDLPFYKKSKTDISKFYEQRINFSKDLKNTGDDLFSIDQKIKTNFIKKSDKFRKKYNTQSYDSFYFNLNGKKNAINYNLYFLNMYAPLWELELVRYSYHLPRYKRFFNNSIREIITMLDPEIAKISTIYGTTASSYVNFLLRDVFFQLFDYSKKGIRLIGRKVFNKNFLNNQVLTWSAEKEVRKLPIAQEALFFAQEKKWISKTEKLDYLSFSLIGRIIHLYMLDRYCQEKS